MTARLAIDLTVNGKRYEGLVEPRLSLADFLRDHCGLTGTHVGCEQGICGSCTAILDGQTIRSCLLLALPADGTSLPRGQRRTTTGRLDARQTLRMLRGREAVAEAPWRR